MIVIDTHVLIWWVNDPEKLSRRAAQLIKKEQGSGLILISSITVWEIYLLIKKNRLKLKVEVKTWFKEIETLPYIQFIPIDNKIASESVDLPGTLHSDPADRIIIATARQKGATLITSDERIRNYKEVNSAW